MASDDSNKDLITHETNYEKKEDEILKSYEGRFIVEEACSSTIPTMYKLDKVYYEGKSKYCDILMGYNPVFGKVLFLDKEIQSSSYDEKLYHEFLVHPAMQTVSNMNNLDILVVGGGEGATVREVLKWSNVRTIDWVDLDNELVELCKKYMNYCDDSVYNSIKVKYIPDDIEYPFTVKLTSYPKDDITIRYVYPSLKHEKFFTDSGNKSDNLFDSLRHIIIEFKGKKANGKEITKNDLNDIIKYLNAEDKLKIRKNINDMSTYGINLETERYHCSKENCVYNKERKKIYLNFEGILSSLFMKLK